jgi:hypothetical protein
VPEGDYVATFEIRHSHRQLTLKPLQGDQKPIVICSGPSINMWQQETISQATCRTKLEGSGFRLTPISPETFLTI